MRCWSSSQTSMRRRNRSQIAAAGRFIKEDDLVAPNRTVFGNRTALDDAVIGVFLQARDEKHALGIERGEPIVIGVATIENHDGSRLETQAARHAAFVHAAFGDERETGEQSLMIEQQMQLHGSFRAPVLRPVENRSTEFDERGVQT